MPGYNDGPEEPSVLDFAFLKDRYDYELSRKEQLTAGLTLPVGVLSALGGLLAVMAQRFSYEDGRLSEVFLVLLVAAVLAFFVCLTFLGLAYHRQKYEYLPLLGEMKESREEFLEFARVMAGGVGEVMEEFEGQFIAHIVKAADNNTRQNETRGGYLYRARVALFCVLGLTAAAGVPYVLDQILR